MPLVVAKDSVLSHLPSREATRSEEMSNDSIMSRMSSSSDNSTCGLENLVVLLTSLADATATHVLASVGYICQDPQLTGKGENGVLLSEIQNYSTSRQLIDSKPKRPQITL